MLYETYQSTYDSLTIGNIQLNEKNQMLSEVSVTGERPLAKAVDGKITYNMPYLLKDKMATSAYEAILELPGVREQSGKIQLAGTNGVTVIINGKTTNMGESQLENLLKNMPKERIQEAEIMYSAPPQYHVRGAVINLVLKSDTSETPKLQGQVNALYNQGYYANFQGGTTLVYNTPKYATDFMYSFGYHRERTGEDILSHHLYDGKTYKIEQFDRGHTRLPIHTIRLGNDWRLNDKNKLSFAYTSEIQQWTHPFTSSVGTYSDSEVSYLNGYTEIQGNPDLRPSRLYSAQLNYILKNKYIFTLYANYIDNNFNQLPYQSSERLVLIYKTLNFNYSSKLGLNVMIPFKTSSVLDSRLTLNGYYDKMKCDNYHGISFNKDNLAFYAELNNTFNL